MIKNLIHRAYVHLGLGSQVLQPSLRLIALMAQYGMGYGFGSHATESGELRALRNCLNRRKRICLAENRELTIIDVGANKGQFINGLRQILGEGGYRVIAFEPGVKTYKALEKISNFPNVTLNNFALGAEESQKMLHYDVAESGLASLTKREVSHVGLTFDKKEMVQVRRFDVYCLEKSVNCIDLLKIDVEGHELDVLRGASRLFSEKKIHAVMFEFGGCNIDTRTFLRDFFVFFQSVGMSNIGRITPTGAVVPLGAYKEEYEQFRTTNYLVSANKKAE